MQTPLQEWFIFPKSYPVAVFGAISQSRFRYRTNPMPPKRCRRLCSGAHVATARLKRCRILKGDPASSAEPPAPPRRCRNLSSTAPVTRRFSQVAGTTLRAPAEYLADEKSEESEGTASSAEVAKAASRKRTLQRRSRRRYAIVRSSGSEPGAAGPTYPEGESVTPGTRAKYTDVLLHFLAWRAGTGEAKEDDEGGDSALCRYMSMLSYVGNYLLSALLYYLPELGKFGSRKVPRSWRTRRGRKKTTPPMSRTPLAFLIWAVVIWELRQAKQWSRGRCVLWMATTYMRPSDPLGIQRQGLAAPSSGICQQWCVILFPETLDALSKVLAKNETIDRHSEPAPWPSGLCPVLQQGTATDHTFNFDYGQFLSAWRRATRREIVQRGRSPSQTPLLRYKKHARLGQSMSRLSPGWRSFPEEAASRLEGLFRGRVAPGSLVRPAIRAGH